MPLSSSDIFFILQGVPTTLFISLTSFIIGFLIGVPLSIIREFTPRYISIIAEVYEKIFRGIPVLVFMLFLYFGIGGMIHIFKDPVAASSIALGMRSGAYQSQIFRGAINSVGYQQYLAGKSLGMGRWSIIRYVIIPQAFIVALPGLGSEISLLIKDSSYSFILGVLDITMYSDILRRAKRIFFEPYLVSAILYIAMTFPIANYLDKKGSSLKTKYGLR